MSRASHTTPSVNAGCGYRASVNNGKVTIYPTMNYANCGITLGLGNATFTFDAANPPDTIKRVITADSNGKYTPQITPTLERNVKLFDSVQDVDESFTDAQGNTTNIALKKLISYKEDGGEVGNYVATGINNVSVHGGRTANMQGTQYFSGAMPYNLDINAVQLFAIRNGYAFLDNDGYVNVIFKGRSTPVKFNMGSVVTDDFIIEFTVKSDNHTFLCKNSDGFALEVYVPFSYGNYFVRKGITQDVIRVAGGQMLKTDKAGVINKSILTDNKNADGSDKIIPMGENGVVDIMPDGNGGVKEIKLSDGKSDVLKTVGNYSLTTDNKLLYNGNEIASNIFAIGSFSQEEPTPLELGKVGTETNIVKNSALSMFNSAGVQSGWNNAYVNWYSSQALPSCGWAGTGETQTTTTTYGVCITRAAMKNHGMGKSTLVMDVNGDIFRADGSTLIKQITVQKDAVGFNAINVNDNTGKFIIFKPDGNIGKFHFSAAETASVEDNYIFRY